MDAELMLKIAGIVGAAVAVLKGGYELMLAPRGRLRDEYNFAKVFLADLKANPKMQEFLKEKGFQALTGSDDITAAEAEYVMQLNKPAATLKHYVAGRPYLEHVATAGNFQIRFRKRYVSPGSRLALKLWYAALYIGGYFAATSPVYFALFGQIPYRQAFALLLPTILFFGSIALYALLTGSRLVRAEVVVKQAASAFGEV